MNAFADDLRYAQATGVAVKVQLLGGEEVFTGVHAVNENEGFVTVYAPEHFNDDTTTKKVALDMITTVTVTDIQWR